MSKSLNPTPASFRSRYGLAIAILLAVVGSVFLLLDARYLENAISNGIGSDGYRALLSFSLGTLLGGLVFLYLKETNDRQEALGAIRQQQERKISEKNSLRIDFLMNMDNLYRQVNQIKRNMRAYVNSVEINGFRIERKKFEELMSSLNEVQAKVESLEEIASVRRDIFTDKTKGRIRAALRYSARCLHDVFEEYENGQTMIEDEYFLIPEECSTIRGFFRKWTPPGDISEPGSIEARGKIAQRWRKESRRALGRANISYASEARFVQPTAPPPYYGELL
jgi:hypothetical protein